MGFLDKIGSLFSGGADDAALQAGGILQDTARQQGGAVDRFEGQALDTLNEAERRALEALQSGDRNALASLNAAEKRALAALTGGRTDFLAATDGARADLESAVGEFRPYTEAGDAASQEQMALQGLLGPEAQEAARSRFTVDPGYQFRFDQGLGALESTAAARGGLYSGGAMKAAQEYGQGLASQEYGNYYNRFDALANRGLTAAGQVSGIRGQQAQLGQNVGNALLGQGERQADLVAGFGRNRADLATGGATNQANALLGTGQNRVGVMTNALTGRTNALVAGGQAQAGGVLGAAQARQAGLNNLLQAGGRIAGAFMG